MWRSCAWPTTCSMIGFRRGRATAAACALALLALGAGCGSEKQATGTGSGGLPRSSERVKLDPADFTTKIDNPYWPMQPGTRWVYRETSGDGPPNRVVVTVTDFTKRVRAGIVARIVHDRVTQAGRLVEDTMDWYAQDGDGNVWYLGEDTREYEDSTKVSTKGSWEAGVDGAQPGVIIPAHPRAGMAYRQEHRAGTAEDRARVLALDERVEVPAGSFDHVLMTRDWTPLEPDVVEHKFYARGMGPVLTMDVSGGRGREELLRVTHRKR
jgi:hypothetical protein